AKPVLPFERLQRLLARQRISADAGMRIKEEQRLFLFLQVLEGESEHRMLEHGGMIAGMVSGAVIHAYRATAGASVAISSAGISPALLIILAIRASHRFRLC